MPQAPLSARQVEALALGTHRVDRGLYLQVKANGARSWIVRYQLDGKPRSMGIGPARLVKLSDARDRALQAQYQLLHRKDPIEERVKARKKVRVPGVISFEEAAGKYIEDNKPEWKNAKHLEQWESTIRTYVNPVIGHLPVTTITTDDVVRLLRPIWVTKSETASRVRGRIERVLASAGVRDADNPAVLGEVQKRLPKLSKVQVIEHHLAVPPKEVPGLFKDVEGRGGSSSAALRFVMLTAARSGEARGATWAEFNLKEKVWTIPAARMKSGKEHRVPLSNAALAVLPERGEDASLVFPGSRPRKPLSDMSLIAVMRKLRGEGATVHGLRSSFRDWAAESTSYPREVMEAALAHTVGNKTEAAYFRSDLFDKRRELMDAWAKFVVGATT